MPTREEIRTALIMANKLGAKGIQIVDYIEPTTTSQSPGLRLITQQGIIESASKVAWYDR